MTGGHRRGGARRLAVAVAVMAGGTVLAATAGCTIPEDREPRALDHASLPPQLVQRPTTTVPPPASEAEVRTMFLVRTTPSPDDTDTLQPVRVQVRVPPGATGSADLARAVLGELLELPNSTQTQLGLRSDIPSTLELRSVTQDAGSDVLTVNLSNLGQVEGPKQRLAAAQIVYTATELPGVKAVRFLVDGQPATVPLEDRTSGAGQPISRDDFPSLNQMLTTRTTPTTAR